MSEAEKTDLTFFVIDTALIVTLQEINLLLEFPGWDQLKAVQDNQIYIADGNQYFNRSGPRITDSIEILAEIIQPKQFIFGYEGTGWIRFRV